MASIRSDEKPNWLFATPLFSFHHPNAAILNQKLWEDACALRRASTGINRSNVNGWHSEYNLFTLDINSFASLKDWILLKAIECTKAINNSFFNRQRAQSITGWANISSKGGLNSPHIHPNNHWSGVYYVKIPASNSLPDTAGMIEFLDPRGHSIKSNALKGASCFKSKIKVEPKEGMLLVFPSYLVHWVYPNESEEERMSIAFKIKYR